MPMPQQCRRLVGKCMSGHEHVQKGEQIVSRASRSTDTGCRVEPTVLPQEAGAVCHVCARAEPPDGEGEERIRWSEFPGVVATLGESSAVAAILFQQRLGCRLYFSRQYRAGDAGDVSVRRRPLENSGED